MSIFNKTYSFTIDSFNESSLISYGLFKNGLFVRKQYPVGTFIHKIQSFDLNVENSASVCQDKFIMSLPKIPAELFYSIVKFFKQIALTIQSEVYVSIFFNKKTNNYFLYVPEQTVSKTSVKFNNNTKMLNNPNYVLVADFHSHYHYNAFVSNTDYSDETASRLFGIIGNLNKNNFSYVFRAATNKYEIKINLEDCFDFQNKSEEELYSISTYDINFDKVKNKIIQKSDVLKDQFIVNTEEITLLNNFKEINNYFKPYDVLSYDLKFIENKKNITEKEIENLVQSLNLFLSQYSSKDFTIDIKTSVPG